MQLCKKVHPAFIALDNRNEGLCLATNGMTLFMRPVWAHFLFLCVKNEETKSITKGHSRFLLGRNNKMKPNIISIHELPKRITTNKIINSILLGDSLEIMKRMPSGSVNLFVTSPPYNLKNSTGNGMKDGRGGKWENAALQRGYDQHSDNMPYDEYCKWQRSCLRQMLRLLSDDGAIFYNHKWRVQAGLLQDRSEIVKGLPVRQIIIWHRKGGINFNKGYFLPTYEVIYLIAKPNFKLAKGANKYGDVWEIKQELNNPHPAPFPESLINRIVSSTESKIIVDPFSGSGTVGVSAIENDRSFILMDNSLDYCKMAQKRISGEAWK